MAVAVLLAISGMGCGGATHPETAGIYSVCLDQLVVRRWQEMKRVAPGEVVISTNALEIERKVVDNGIHDLEGKLSYGTAGDFLRANNGFVFPQPAARIRQAVSCILPTRYIESTDTGEFSWSAFHEQYPRSCGLVTLSRVGLNAKRDEALVAFDWIWDPEAGQTELVLLRRLDDKWVVVAKTLLGVY